MKPAGKRVNEPALGALEEAIGRLYPGGEITTGAATGGDSFYVVPSLRTPRLLIPTHPAAASHSLLRFSAALPAREAIGRLALAFLRRTGLSILAGTRISVRGATDSLREHLDQFFEDRVSVSLGIGNSRANRKPVVGVFSSRGEPLAYAKVGTDPSTADLVRTETDSLRLLSNRDLGFDHPRVLHATKWMGMPLLVMSPLRTTPWQGFRPRRPPIEVIGGLTAAFSEGRRQLDETPLWERLSSVGEALAPSDRSAWSDGLAGVEARHGSTMVDVAAWHGDLTPWNLARRRGLIQVWDWERFEIGVPVGFDALHYSLQTRLAGADPSPTEVRSAMAPLNLDQAIGASYLLTLAARYLQADNPDPGITSRVRDKGRRVLKAAMEVLA